MSKLPDKIHTPWNQELFDWLYEKGIIPTASEMQEVIDIVREIDKDSIKANPLDWEWLFKNGAEVTQYKGKPKQGIVEYRIVKKIKLWWLYSNANPPNYLKRFATARDENEAKAAAQEHYDNFIKSQIL